jgi:hypothetical protein
MTTKIPPVVKRMLARHAILADEQKDESLDLFAVICGDEDPQTTGRVVPRF